MRFDMIGLVCGGAARDLTVHMRVSEDGEVWGEWLSAPVERAADRGGRDQSFTDPVWVGSARRVQLAVTAPSGDAGRRVPSPRLVFLNTSGDASAIDGLAAAVRRFASTVAGLRTSVDALAMTREPTIVTRSQWGANESWRSSDGPYYAPVKMVFVHHTVSRNSYSRSQAAGIVRGVYYYHAVSLGWSDIGYNFLIDRYGTVYEGRRGGVTRGVIGAQTLGFNTGSTGVSLIGTFTSASPPSAMTAALKKFLAWKLDVHHVDPRGTAAMTCAHGQKYRTGQTVTFPAIAGHRQANYTTCPGNGVYSLLPGMRKAVGNMGLPKIYAFALDRTAISPNGDAVAEKLTTRFTVSEPASWTVTVQDAAGVPVRRLTGAGDAVRTSWNGRADGGAVVADGAYRLVASAESDRGEARAAVAAIRVDTRAPQAKELKLSTSVFSPNGDLYADKVRLTYRGDESVSARLAVRDEAGTTVRVLHGWRAVGTARKTMAWDGRVKADGELVRGPEGRYAFELLLRDAAGNIGTLTTPVNLDLTLGFLKVKPASFSPTGDGVKDTATFSFKLTRRADVTVRVLDGQTMVRRFGMGSRGAGTQSVVWDGLDDHGAAAPSRAYRVEVAANGAEATARVVKPVTVDRTRPRISAPLTATVKLGSTLRLSYTVRDGYSATARVRVTVTRASSGAVVKTLDRGWVTTGKTHVVSWKPLARRGYVATFRAVDRAGNGQVETVATRISVR
jgi:flagellar hook assembly protein FlgD